MSGRKPNAVLKSYEYAATLDEIARTLGVSKERVRQIESQALAKAKRILRKRGFTLQNLLPDGDRAEPECSPGLEEV